MDIEKLTERPRTESLYADKASLEIMDLCMDAATALSTIQAENEQLRHRLSEAVSACSRIAEWAQNTGHDYVEGIAREFLEEDGYGRSHK